LLRTSGPIGSNRILFSHGALGVAIGLSLLCAIIGLWPGLVAGLLHAMLYVFVIAPLINALGHWGCARNFENSASNWRLLAWFTGGESLHSNHHAHPRSPKFSVRGSEFDPSWPIIRSLAARRAARHFWGHRSRGRAPRPGAHRDAFGLARAEQRDR
jgi:fatty-acid desaturase